LWPIVCFVNLLTFHKKKLYEDTGVDAQALAGHTNRKMTEQYKVGHETEWTLAEANLKLAEIL
jgi:hypothetical protein